LQLVCNNSRMCDRRGPKSARAPTGRNTDHSVLTEALTGKNETSSRLETPRSNCACACVRHCVPTTPPPRVSRDGRTHPRRSLLSPRHDASALGTDATCSVRRNGRRHGEARLGTPPMHGPAAGEGHAYVPWWRERCVPTPLSAHPAGRARGRPPMAIPRLEKFAKAARREF